MNKMGEYYRALVMEAGENVKNGSISENEYEALQQQRKNYENLSKTACDSVKKLQELQDNICLGKLLQTKGTFNLTTGNYSKEKCALERLSNINPDVSGDDSLQKCMQDIMGQYNEVMTSDYLKAYLEKILKEQIQSVKITEGMAKGIESGLELWANPAETLELLGMEGAVNYVNYKLLRTKPRP